MCSTHTFIRSNVRSTVVVAVVVLFSLLAGHEVVALPAGGELAAGKATISTPSLTAMQIEQQSSQAIINWSSFGIGRGESVNVVQPDSRSALLNRVSGEDPSELFGTLSANGRLFLVNPNGVLFAPGASINVGGLVTSTLDIRNSDFLSEKYAFFRHGTAGSVINQGSLSGGFIALLGKNVSNTGTIVTTGGTTGIAAGEKITLNLDPSGLVAIRVEETAYNAQIRNSGVIEANDGRVVIKASAADALLASVVNNSGQVRATSMKERNGTIVLEGASIINTGTFTASAITVSSNNLIDAGTWNAGGSASGGTIAIDATGNIEQTAASRMTADGAEGGQIELDAGKGLYLSGMFSANGSSGRGGRISITAPQTFLAGAQIEANGQNGGGSILIGGGWQGKSSYLANAESTTVTGSCNFKANALENGNGGTVVLWSNHSTAFSGTIEAMGGHNSGNGGEVELSSHETLTLSGQVSTGAPHGNNGFLLLDPQNITIDASVTIPLFSLIPLPDANPAEGDQHGSGDILELSNGNILVASPFDDFVATDAGAVRLYRPDGTLLSMLCGSTANDQIGETVTALTGRKSAVTSTSEWSNGDQAAAGAVTWINESIGVSGSVSGTNSLVGSTANDGTSIRVITLNNGNYVVSSPGWDNGTASDAGAVTWGNGLSGTIGVISAANSLVGSKKNDQVGTVTALTNGHYVVSSPLWDKGTVTNAGAVTWSNGLGGTVGTISATNSLVGSKTGDQVGSVTALKNGNYVVSAPNWDNGSITNAGMATLVNGLNGAVGTIIATNSLVGSKKEDKVGTGVTALANGHYVVTSPAWDNGTTTDAGAVTWGNGINGAIGVISTTNSLVGSTANDLASAYVTALANGNYVVGSPEWDNGPTTNAGAVTWGNGIGGTAGMISSSNSLTSSAASDGLGSTVTALTNGNYVAAWPHWDNGTATDAGAVSWGNGNGGSVGTISPANSLVGSTVNDGTRYNIIPLTNGNYVIGAPYWDNGPATDAGAVTWGNGFEGTTGVIGEENSLIGSSKNDYAGSDSSGKNNITALNNGNYVASSILWDQGTTANTGAVTWGDGLGGSAGVISSSNSLVGSKTGDQVGTVTALPNGNYIVSSPLWNNGTLTNAGALTLLDGLNNSTTGALSSLNSLVGSSKEEQLGIGGITALTIGNMNGSFVVSSFNRANETGWVEILTPNPEQASVEQEYSFNPDAANTFHPSQITALLNKGSQVVLKANNDITINSSIIADNPLGNGGNLYLNAGRSILLNATISTDNGNLTIVSNDTQASGVVDQWRSAGNATITMGEGTSIRAGSGNVTIELRDGSGNTNRESGDITLRNITASNIIALNFGPTEGSGITLASGTLASEATEGSTIILAGNDFDNSANARLSTNGTARWLVYADNPETTIEGELISDFRRYNASYISSPPFNMKESGNGFIYAINKQPINFNEINPILSWQSETEHRAKRVLSGETLFSKPDQTINSPQKSFIVRRRAIKNTKYSSQSGDLIAPETITVPARAEALFFFSLPDSIFSNSNPDAIVTLEAHSINGTAVPSWISFDPKRKIISGKAPKEAIGKYRIELVAKDKFGGESRSIVLITIG